MKMMFEILIYKKFPIRADLIAQDLDIPNRRFGISCSTFGRTRIYSKNAVIITHHPTPDSFTHECLWLCGHTHETILLETGICQRMNPRLDREYLPKKNWDVISQKTFII